MPLIDNANTDLIQLNTSFDRWLDKAYQKSFHHGIKTRPIDRWMDDLATTPIKRISAQELDLAFYITIKRKVKNDSTISVHSILYEVPPRFIGKVIELRFPSDKQQDLTIYEHDKPVHTVKRVNLHENANLPAWGIKFDQTNKGDKND